MLSRCARCALPLLGQAALLPLRALWYMFTFVLGLSLKIFIGLFILFILFETVFYVGLEMFRK